MNDKRINFTKRALDYLPFPANGQYLTIHDVKAPGLFIRITATGHKTFNVQRRVNGKPQRVKLGWYPEMTIEQARRKSRTVLNQLAEGINPIVQQRAEWVAADTLREVFDTYLLART